MLATLAADAGESTPDTTSAIALTLPWSVE
jgi:hypothetical protein